MAVTHGHGNPKWTRDETILALDLYFDCKGHVTLWHSFPRSIIHRAKHVKWSSPSIPLKKPH